MDDIHTCIPDRDWIWHIPFTILHHDCPKHHKHPQLPAYGVSLLQAGTSKHAGSALLRLSDVVHYLHIYFGNIYGWSHTPVYRTAHIPDDNQLLQTLSANHSENSGCHILSVRLSERLGYGSIPRHDALCRQHV